MGPLFRCFFCFWPPGAFRVSRQIVVSRGVPPFRAFSVFRPSRAPPCAPPGASGGPSETPPDPRKSCFRLGKTTISAFEAFSALCGPERKKTRCARMRFSPIGPFLGPRESRGSPRGVPEEPLLSPRVEKKGVQKSTRKKHPKKNEKMRGWASCAGPAGGGGGFLFHRNASHG